MRNQTVQKYLSVLNGFIDINLPKGITVFKKEDLYKWCVDNEISKAIPYYLLKLDLMRHAQTYANGFYTLTVPKFNTSEITKILLLARDERRTRKNEKQLKMSLGEPVKQDLHEIIKQLTEKGYTIVAPKMKFPEGNNTEIIAFVNHYVSHCKKENIWVDMEEFIEEFYAY
jgi:hypothetical protein